MNSAYIRYEEKEKVGIGVMKICKNNANYILIVFGIVVYLFNKIYMRDIHMIWGIFL